MALVLLETLTNTSATLLAQLLRPPSPTDGALQVASAGPGGAEKARQVAWRTALLIAFLFLIATLSTALAFVLTTDPITRVVLWSLAAWWFVAAIALRLGRMGFTTAREANTILFVAALFVSMLRYMQSAERCAMVPDVRERYLHMVLQHPPTAITLFLWLFCSTWKTFLASAVLLLGLFAASSPGFLSAQQHEAVTVQFLAGGMALLWLCASQWTSESLMDEVGATDAGACACFLTCSNS